MTQQLSRWRSRLDENAGGTGAILARRLSSFDGVQGLRMVPVLRAEGTFHARVVAARLGSEGILAQLRGNVDGPYPMGSVEVLVTEDDLEAARELLLADEVESSFDSVSAEAEGEELAPEPVPSYRGWLLVVASGLVALSAVLSSLVR